MRIFTVRGRSNFAGEHMIYEGETEFEKYMPGVPVKIWNKDFDIQTGDWVRAEDGYIVKCLKVSVLRTKKVHVKEGVIYLYKFPQGTFYHRIYGSGKVRTAKFCAQFSVNHVNNINGAQRNTRTEKERGTFAKTKFIGLLLSGMPLYQSYKASIGYYPVSNNTLKKKVLEAFMDPEVQLALKEKYQPFLDKVSTDEEFSDEAMVKYIKDFMTHVRKGSMVHLQSIIPLLRLMGKLPEEEPKEKKINKADHIGFEEIPPPTIGK